MNRYIFINLLICTLPLAANEAICHDFESVHAEAKLMIVNNDYDGARTVIQDALNKTPRDIRLKNLIGLTYFGEKKYEKAIPYLAESTSFRPVNTLKALALSYTEVKGTEKGKQAIIAPLMLYRKDDSEVVGLLILIGDRLGITSPLYYKAVIADCPMDYLLANSEIRTLFEMQPTYFFNEGEWTLLAEEYGLSTKYPNKVMESTSD